MRKKKDINKLPVVEGWKKRKVRNSNTDEHFYYIQIGNKKICQSYAEYATYNNGVFSLFLRLPKPNDNLHQLNKEMSQKAVKIALRRELNPKRGMSICVVDKLNKTANYDYFQYLCKLDSILEYNRVMSIIDIVRDKIKYDELDEDVELS